MPTSPSDPSHQPPWWPVAVVAALTVAGAVRGRRTAPRAVVAGKSEGRGNLAPGVGSHGRGARSPTEIPAPGWWDILKRLYTSIDNDRILAVAAGVTFYALLALFPAVTALVSLYGLFADPATITDQMNNLSSILPGGATEIIGEQVKRIAEKGHGSLSVTFVFGLGVALWSANAGVKALFDALNVAYEAKEQRSFIKLNAISLVFTLGAILMLILAMGAVVVVPVVLNFLGLGGIGTALIALARWPLLLAAVVLALSVLYRWGPSRADAQWRWITPGSAFAAVGWLVASVGFSIYVSRFGSYNATYGSLGAAIGLMTWMWISSIVVLVGAELSAQIEQQTRRVTTTGGGKAGGASGARRAGSVGR